MPQTFDVLREREAEWAPALRSVSLVAEVDAGEERIGEVVQALGRAYRLADYEERTRLFAQRYAACLVTGLAGVGALKYQAGNYWGAVRDVAGVHLSAVDQRFLGDCFGDGLDRFHLARFRGLPQKYVGEILMHSGVPVYCLADLLNLLLYRQSRDAGLTGEDFLAWALAPGRESRLYGVDKPVERFLRHGGDYAEDLVDRLLDLLDRLRQPAFHADGLGLSPHLIAAAQDLAEQKRLDWWSASRRGMQTASTTRLRPRLELEPFGRGVVVWLPPVANATDGMAQWRIRAAGAVEEVLSRSPWPGATQAPATVVPLPKPVHEVTIELSGYHEEYELDVVDQRDPLLVFTDDGRQVSANADVTPGPVWLFYPATDYSGRPLELKLDGILQDDYEVPTPYGWLGWTLRRADLRNVTLLQLADGGRRRVKGARRAEAELTKPLPGVQSTDGAPVIADLPRLTLPTDPGAVTQWTVQVRHPSSGQVLSVEHIAASEETTIDPWRRLPRPLVGSYEIIARGPLGRGLSRKLVIAEGLRVRYHPSWRPISARGLEPAVVRASSVSAGLTVEPRQAPLEPAAASVEVQVGGLDGTSEILSVTPPHMAVQRLGARGRSNWSLFPLRIDTETIAEGELLVRLPQTIETQLVVHVGGQEVQDLNAATAYGQPLARFKLAAIADTVQSHGAAQLRVRLGDKDYPVAYCAPRQLARGVRLVDDRLVLVEGVAAEGLVAGLYQVYAPWQPPHVVRVNPDLRSDPLPEHLTAAGPLVVYLRVEDPWLPESWPDWPTNEANVLPITDLQWSQAPRDPATEAVSSYLAGVGHHPDRPDVAPLLYPLYRRADDLSRSGLSENVRDLAADILSRHPAAALHALTTTTVAADDLVAPIVHAYLVALGRQQYMDAAVEERLWKISPLAAMLACAYRLDDLADRPGLREQVVITCGGVATKLLDGEADPYAAVGQFGDAERLAELPAEQLDGIWKAMRLIPGGLLDADGRLVAARQLFDARDKPGVRRVAAVAEWLLATLRGPLDDVGGRVVTAAVQARRPGCGWLALPGLSLALAFAARLAARGYTKVDKELRVALPHYAALARGAPNLVTVDLLLAEFILTGAGAAS